MSPSLTSGIVKKNNQCYSLQLPVVLMLLLTGVLPVHMFTFYLHFLKAILYYKYEQQAFTGISTLTPSHIFILPTVKVPTSVL